MALSPIGDLYADSHPPGLSDLEGRVAEVGLPV